MNALWLLLIVPMAVAVGYGLACLCWVSSRADVLPTGREVREGKTVACSDWCPDASPSFCADCRKGWTT